MWLARIIKNNQIYKIVKMKVVHVFWGLGFGGIETMLLNITNAQAHYGAEVHIVLINRLYEQSLLDRIDSAVKVHTLNRKLGSKGLGFMFRLNKMLNSINPDKIHLHGPQFYGMLFSKKLSRKASLTLHALPALPIKHGSMFGMWLARFTLGICGGEQLVVRIPKLFSISNAVRAAFRDKYGVDSIVVCNGIQTANFLQKTKFAPSSYKIIQISRLEHEMKGQDLLIKAASILKGMVDVTFIGDGESLEYLQKLTSELHADDYVHFVGKKSQVYIAEHLKDYDLFVQPSRKEGFGLTVAEAMAAKVPVLVSLGQGPAEVTEGEKFGWTFVNGNAEDLASQIKFIFEHYDDAIAKVETAWEHVRMCYDVSVTAKMYLKYY